MPVPAHHQEIGAAVGGVGKDHVFDRKITLAEAFEIGSDTVACKMIAHIGARDVLVLALFGDDNEVDRLGAFQEGHGLGDGACRRAAAVPACEHALEGEPALLDVGHDEDRSRGFEQCPFDDQLLGCSMLALRLTDDGEVEAARDARE